MVSFYFLLVFFLLQHQKLVQKHRAGTEVKGHNSFHTESILQVELSKKFTKCKVNIFSVCQECSFLFSYEVLDLLNKLVYSVKCCYFSMYELRFERILKALSG